MRDTTRNPRIMVVASYYYPKIGGLEAVAHTLSRILHESGDYDVSVITTNYDSKGYRREIIDGITVHRLPAWLKISNTPVNPLWRWQIKRIFAEWQPDIVHTHSPVPVLADIAAKVAKENHIPVVSTYHAGSMRKGRWPVDALINLYESVFLPKLFKRSDAIVTVYQDFARHAFPQFMDKTVFISTGVDLGRFKKTPLADHRKTVTFVGRIEYASRWKGIEELLRAMAAVIKRRPDAQLALIGGGDALGHYRQRAGELGISRSVTMTGPLRGADLIRGYENAAVVVLPSTSDSEAFSVSLLEAMAMGRPVIGTAIGGTPQIIDNEENGLLVRPKDPEALAVAILRILDDPALAKRLADAGAAKARTLSWDSQAAKYRAVFQKVLGERRLTQIP